VDLGLIPVAVIPELKEHHIISDYCIGAEKKVESVMLYSEVPLEQIDNVLLDYQSRTSVALVQILAKNYWKIHPQWIPAKENFENEIGGKTAAVIIGDRTFGMKEKYRFSYDLAEEWQKFTGLPFVFACWVSNKVLPDDFVASFNQAIKKGLEDRPSLIKELKAEKRYDIDVNLYLNSSISYDLNTLKKQALQMFLNYLKELQK
jgi:chorismate dehydratase